jgi:DNA-binding response OmpR family regulator
MGEKVLVVDDDPDIVKFIEVTLTRAGFDVGVAFDGREALGKVSGGGPTSSCRHHALDRRVQVARPPPPRRLTGMAIIIVSAPGLPEDRLRGASISVDDYVKPFTRTSARARRALRRSRCARSAGQDSETVLIEEEIRRALERGDAFAPVRGLDN